MYFVTFYRPSVRPLFARQKRQDHATRVGHKCCSELRTKRGSRNFAVFFVLFIVCFRRNRLSGRTVSNRNATCRTGIFDSTGCVHRPTCRAGAFTRGTTRSSSRVTVVEVHVLGLGLNTNKNTTFPYEPDHKRFYFVRLSVPYVCFQCANAIGAEWVRRNVVVCVTPVACTATCLIFFPI